MKRVISSFGIGLTIGMVLLWNGVSLSETKQENLVKNPSFEEGKSSWVPYTYKWGEKKRSRVVYSISNDAHSGKHSAYIKIEEPVSGHVGWHQCIKLAPDTTYTVSAWIKTKDLQPGGNVLRVYMGAKETEDKKLKHCKTFCDYVERTTDWTYYKHTFTTSKGPMSKRALPPFIYPIYLNSAKAGEVWIDEVSIVKGEAEDVIVQDVADRKRTVFRGKLNEIKAKLDEVKAISDKAKNWKEDISAEVSSLGKKIEGVFTISNVEEIEGSCDYLDSLICALKEDRLKFKDILLYTVKPIKDKNREILPHATFFPGEIADSLFVVATPGEYEPASFVVRPIMKDIKSLKLEVSDLKSKKGGTISSSNIDIKVVKCWYQSGGIEPTAPHNQGKHLLVPELLLNDDSLIKVDYEKKENYVKLLYSEKYCRLSNREDAMECPVKEDSPKLLPVNIKKDTNKQFWLTVKVPEDASAGVYTSRIKLKTADEVLGNLNLKLKVLPFKLASPKTYYDPAEGFISSMYYMGIFNPHPLPAEWTIWGRAGREYSLSEDAYSGKYSAHIRMRGKCGKHGGFYQQLLRSKPNTTYTFSAWIKTKDVSSPGVRILSPVGGGTIKGTTEWTYYEFTSGSASYLYPVITRGVEHGDVWIDDVRIVEVKEASSAGSNLIINPSFEFIGSSPQNKSPEQYRKDMENFFAHGVTNPMLAGRFIKFTKSLGEALTIRNEAGMDNRTLYFKKNIGNPTTTKALESLKNEVKKAFEFVKPYGTKEVYFYGICEALRIGGRGIDTLISQRPAWEAVHEAGGKIFVAGVPVNLFSGKCRLGNFGFMGDIQDLFICCGPPSREEAARWHSKGQKITCYANPQGGMEAPETYRRNYGLLLWKNNYDGAMTWTYQYGKNENESWNDFIGKVGDYRSHNMAYPALNGPIDTVQWEGYREGMDDVKYATTLMEAIEEAKKSGDRKIREIAVSAEKYLDKLDVNGDLDNIRLEMIVYILRLKGAI